MPDNHTELASYFSILSRAIADGLVLSEAHVSAMVGVGEAPPTNLMDVLIVVRQLMAGAWSEPDKPKRASAEELASLFQSGLLSRMGYQADFVVPECPVRHGSSNIKVDFRIGPPDNRHTWLLELKAPNEDCDSKKNVDELTSYLETLKVPVGVLFNGIQARVHVNYGAEFSELAKLAGVLQKKLSTDEHFRLGKAVLELADEKTLTGLFTQFCHIPGGPDTVALAKRLMKVEAKRIENEVANKHRQTTIREQLQSILWEPPNDVLKAIIGASEKLSELQANSDELRNAWRILNAGPPKPKGTGADTNVRYWVARACGKVGFEALEKECIPGLKMRCDGQESDYYHLVLRGPRVPMGLCVRQVDSVTAAQSIIAHLRSLTNE